MRISISQFGGSIADGIALAQAAESCGFDTLWLGEHVIAPMVYTSDHPTPAGQHDTAGLTDPDVKPKLEPSVHLVDPMIALSAIATATRTLRIATGIYLIALRHPLLVARAAATLAEVSQERFTLGVATGWLREEFSALAVPFADRTARMEEQIAVVRKALGGGAFEFRGRFYDFDSVHVVPGPVNVPIVLGGNSEPALRRAVRLADGWFTSGIPTFDEALRLRDRIDVLSAEHSRELPLSTTWRMALPEPDLLDRYAAEGFTDVSLMAHDVWAGPTIAARRAHLADIADRLDIAGRAAAV